MGQTALKNGYRFLMLAQAPSQNCKSISIIPCNWPAKSARKNTVSLSR